MYIDNCVVKVYSNNIHIENSYIVKKKCFHRFLVNIKNLYPNNKVIKNRKLSSLKFEWATHNFIYIFAKLLKLKNIVAKCEDVDLNWPQKWYINWIYNTLGIISWIFIK